MPKFLWKASYSPEGVKGVLNEGGSSRRAVVEQMTSALGGSLEAFYYAFGDADVYVIADTGTISANRSIRPYWSRRGRSFDFLITSILFNTRKTGASACLIRSSTKRSPFPGGSATSTTRANTSTSWMV